MTSDVQLAAGDPELRHLMVDVVVGQERVSYQLLTGLRAELPPALAGASIGAMPDGRIAYDGAADPELTAVLLRGIVAQRSVGPLRFGTEPGAIVDGTAPGRTLPALASNTSVVFGEAAILKLLRRPFAGHHPDLEVPSALARNGSQADAGPLGWIEMPPSGQPAGAGKRCRPGCAGHLVGVFPPLQRRLVAGHGEPAQRSSARGRPTQCRPAQCRPARADTRLL